MEGISKIKITRLLIYTLMIAIIFQVGAISLVQAEDYSLTRILPPISPDDTVLVSSDDPNLISTEDQVVIMSENGTLISPAPETTIREEEIEKTTPVDDTTIGLPEDENQEDMIPLIAPLSQEENQNPTTLGAVLLAIALGTIATVYIVVDNKKTK